MRSLITFFEKTFKPSPQHVLALSSVVQTICSPRTFIFLEMTSFATHTFFIDYLNQLHWENQICLSPCFWPAWSYTWVRFLVLAFPWVALPGASRTSKPRRVPNIVQVTTLQWLNRILVQKLVFCNARLPFGSFLSNAHID